MSRKSISLLFVMAAVTLFSAVTGAVADVGQGVLKEDYKYIMPLSQVKPGMKAYGLTVFKGTKIEKFGVDIIGILRKMNHGKDLILVRLSGGPVTERHANIIQGMSGSPVYINGKIIGAVAYGPGGFGREPLGMLTPIEDMLDAIDPNLPDHPSGLSCVSTELNAPLKLGTQTINRIEIRDRKSDQSASAGTFVMTPLMSPLMCSGLSPKSIAKLADMLEPYGIVPMAGPGGKADVVPVDLVPGAAVGVSTVTGDIDMTGIGTVTYRRGNKLVAFGHPMMGIGPIDVPMTTAWIYDVYPSYNVSFKFGSPMKTVGRIYEDRFWSIGGEIGKYAKTIPLTIDVNDVAINRTRTFKVNVLNHPLLAPKLMLTVASEAIADMHGFPGDVMATVNLQMDVDQVGKISRENTYFDPGAIEDAAIGDFQNLLAILTNNRFQPLDVKSVHMSVKIERGRKTATVERIFVDKDTYEPGETVNVGVELMPYKSEKIIKYTKVRIPENTPDCKLTLQVRGGYGGSQDGAVVVSMDGESPEPRVAPVPGGAASGVCQLVDKYLETEKNTDIITKVLLPSASLNINGEKLSNLPDAIANVMKSMKSSGLKLEREEVKSVNPSNYLILGGQTLPITVQRRYPTGRKPGADQPQGGAPQPGAQVAAFPTDNNMNMASSMPSTLIPMADTPAVDAEPAKDTPPTGSGPAEQPADASKTAAAAAATTPADQAAPVAEAKTEDKPAAKKEPRPEKPKPEPAAPEKPIGRQLSVWTQKSLPDFAPGLFEGTAFTSENDVRLVQVMKKLASVPESYVWAVVPDGRGGVYAGTGNSGIIYKVTKDGNSSVFFKTEQLEVHSLAVDSKGNLYAGTSPNGKIFKISPSGNGSVVYDASDKYILKLAVDSKDNVYAGAGDSGKIYQINPAGKAKVFAEPKAQSIQALVVDKSDNVYAGTGNQGVVYKITPEGAIDALYNADEDSITSLAVDSKGNVLAGTGNGKGNIYKIPASGGTVYSVFGQTPRALGMSIDKNDNLYITSDSHIFKITSDEVVMLLDTQRAGAQFTSIAIDDNGNVFGGSSNSGAVYHSVEPKESTYQSVVQDTGLQSKWGNISWVAVTPEGSAVTFETRTGNVVQPDDTWSDWSPAYTNAAGEKIGNSSARYIQYRAIVNGSADKTPVLKQVSVSYLNANRTPKVIVNEPAIGTYLCRTQTIKWTGNDPDKDTLSYELFFSADNGATWQALGSAVKQAAKAGTDKPEEKKPESAPVKEEPKKEQDKSAPPTADDIVNQVKDGLSKHPEVPQDVKDKLLAQVPSAVGKSIANATSPTAVVPDSAADSGPGAQTKQTTFSWDTTKIPDGSYLIKVVVNDRVSNASGYLTDSKVYGPLLVANTPPTIASAKKDVKVGADRVVTVTGITFTPAVPLAGVQYKVDSGDWMAAESTDGLFDSSSEGFIVTTMPLDPGKHTIEIKAIDAVGNNQSTKVDAEVK